MTNVKDFIIKDGVLVKYTGRAMEVAIPDGVTEIGDIALCHRACLTGVTIPDGVTRIGEYAFAECYRLARVSIPDSMAEIDSCVFYECAGLESIVIPEGTVRIGSSAFWGCSGLKSITIPASVTEIGSHTFHGCDGLTDIHYGGSRTRWDAVRAFAQDTGNGALLKADVHFKDGEERAAEPGTYLVTVARTGAVHVRADGPEQAREIADALTTDEIGWDDGWDVTDCQATPGYVGPAVTAE